MEGISQGARAEDVPRLTEHLFRHEAGKLVSMLTGIFGIERLQLAEDVVQEALIRAMKTWPFYGVPKNPPAWLMQTAKHLALDAIRREKWFQDRLPQITATLEQWPEQGEAASPRFAEELSDGRLRLMFLCCHPDIPPESQIALALKTLCGFSPAEIARAFFTSEAAIAKRLTRARQRIQELCLRFEIPAGPELSERLDGVLHILYLLFSEGYKASAGDRLIREELCQEALRLGELLAGHPSTGRPRTHALVALMWLNAARLSGRTGPEGGLLRLEDQDRSRWNREMLARGVRHLGISAQGTELSEYHLQAGIAACHGLAPDYGSTDWPRILEYYDRWAERNPSPVVALNRAVALARVKGPEAGIAAVQAIPGREQLDSYHLVYAVLGEFEAERRNFQAAAAHFRKALQLAELKSEQNHLEGRLGHVGRI